MVLDMAADLIKADAFRDFDDAKQHLHWCGYPMVDVMILVHDAMQWAMQAMVAAEMSER